MIKAYLLYFDMENIKFKADVLTLNNESEGSLDIELCRVLMANGYDICDYSDEIAVVVDDQGFFKPDTPVFEIISKYGDTMKLAGRLLFVRNVENEFSTDIGSIRDEDIFNLQMNLDIKLVGMTKGVE